MKKILVILILNLISYTPIAHSLTWQELHNNGVKALQAGGKIIFLRHAYAPRTVENGNWRVVFDIINRIASVKTFYQIFIPAWDK